jgi:hypothetical protein
MCIVIIWGGFVVVTSPTFDDYCTAVGIDCQYPVPYIHFKNSLAKAIIECLQVIARPLLMHSQLPTTAWGHSVLHANALVPYWPSAFSPHQIGTGIPPDLSHLCSFGCQIMVPIASPKRTKMGFQRQLRIYVGFDSPSIICYLEPTTKDVFKARHMDCYFDENIFSKLNILNQHPLPPLEWERTSPFWQDIWTNHGEREVQRIRQLHKIVEVLPDSFADASQVTHSHIPAANAPTCIALLDVPAITSKPRQKQGRPPGAKDKQPRQCHAHIHEIFPTPADTSMTNEEVAIHYSHTGIMWDRQTTLLDDNFALMVANHVTNNTPEPIYLNPRMSE